MESLRCCDEIVVVDSGSAGPDAGDRGQAGARVIESPWRGYAQQKNLAAERSEYDWILSIDADEALSEAWKARCGQIKKNGAQFDATRCRRWLSTWVAGFCTLAVPGSARSGCIIAASARWWRLVS